MIQYFLEKNPIFGNNYLRGIFVKKIRVELVLQVKTTPKDFKSYYNDEKTFLYNICYIKERGKLYRPFDMDSRIKDGLYIAEFYFKLTNIEKTPKISYGLHIFENNKEVRSEIKIISVNSEVINKQE